VDVAPATLAWPDLTAWENETALMSASGSLASVAKRWFSSCCSRSSLINWRRLKKLHVTASAMALSNGGWGQKLLQANGHRQPG
jgi:hypothetical protein